MKLHLATILLIAIASHATAADLARLRTLDLSQLEEEGLFELEAFAAKPMDGVLKSWKLKLPEFESAVYFSSDGQKRFLGVANRIYPWVVGDRLSILRDESHKPDPTARTPSENGLLVLLKLTTGEYLLLQGAAGPETLSFFTVLPGGELALKIASFGQAAVQTDAPLMAWARGLDHNEVFAKAWRRLVASDTIRDRARLRSSKEYPEPFRYLGWCSWEQYRRQISGPLLEDAIGSIESCDLPIRWVLVDDGHQHQTGRTMRDSRLLSFEACPEKFPEGLEALTTRKSDKIRWMGLWHAMNGLWQGMSEQHEMPELAEHFIATRNGSLMPAGNASSSAAFYEKLVGSAKGDGFDFVKIDNQNRLIPFYRDRPNGVRAVANHAQSLEAAAEKHLEGMINCFCVDTLAALNTKHSVVSRVSVDYLLNNEAKAKSHLLQSYHNTLWIGQVAWPDHDMFHSSDQLCARMMAVSKAISGGPVYLSDAPADFQPEHVWPLIHSDGEILRPLAPAVPLPDSVMLDALIQEQAYRVVAPLPHACVAIVAYCLTHPTPDAAVPAMVTPDDYQQAAGAIQPPTDGWCAPAEGLVCFDWYEQAGCKLDNEYRFELTGFADRLVQLSPITDGWSVVGSPEKFLCAAAVESIESQPARLVVRLVEPGPLVVYSKAAIQCDQASEIIDLGEGLWRIEPLTPDATRELRITRIAEVE